MTNIQISILTVFTALMVVALLYWVLMNRKEEPLVWRIGLAMCMVLLLIAVVMVFSSYARYAALTGMVGVMCKIGSLAIVTARRTRRASYSRSRKNYAIQAIIFFLLTLTFVAPNVANMANQQNLKERQMGIAYMLGVALHKIDELIDLLTVDIKERRESAIIEAKRDSARAIEVRRNQIKALGDIEEIKRATGASGEIQKGQRRDRQSRKATSDQVRIKLPTKTPSGRLELDNSSLLLSPTRTHPYYRIIAKPKKDK